MLRSSRARAAALGLLVPLVCVPRAALAAGPQFSFPEPPALASAAQLEGAIATLFRSNWQAYADLERSDPAQRAQLRELGKHLLTAEADARLKELTSQARAQEAAGTANLQATLAAARELLWQESFRWSLLEWRLAFAQSFDAHERSVQRLVDALPPEARAEPAPRIAAARASVDAGFAAAMSADAADARTAAIEQLTGSLNALFTVYNQVRSELAASLSREERTRGAVPAQPREEPCPLAVLRTSGRELPALAADNSAPNSFYPESSRHAQFEGMVTVEAWVTASGCMEKAAVYESSGVAELDQAAIRWTQQANFYPAERDHRAVDATLRFRIRFQLTP